MTYLNKANYMARRYCKIALVALALLALAGCKSWWSNDTDVLKADPPAQQQNAQPGSSSGFADKQYIWQDWTTDSSQFKGQVK